MSRGGTLSWKIYLPDYRRPAWSGRWCEYRTHDPRCCWQKLLGAMILALGVYSRLKKQLGQEERSKTEMKGWIVGGIGLALIGIINGSLTAGQSVSYPISGSLVWFTYKQAVALTMICVGFVLEWHRWYCHCSSGMHQYTGYGYPYYCWVHSFGGSLGAVLANRSVINSSKRLSKYWRLPSASNYCFRIFKVIYEYRVRSETTTVAKQQ